MTASALESSSSIKYCHRHLPPEVRELADKNFGLMRNDPHHPSVRLKKVGGFWSARVGLHSEYDRLIQS